MDYNLLEARTTEVGLLVRGAPIVFTQKLSKIINHDADARSVFYKFPPGYDW